MITLALDASTYRGSVAIIRDGIVSREAEVAMKGVEVEQLMPAVEQSLLAEGLSVGDLDRLVCGEGPGSFTSLRIAGSIAKGLAFGAGTPLFAVSSLALVVAGRPGSSGRFLVALDAMRGESYVALVSVAADGEVTVRPGLRLLAGAELQAAAEAEEATLVGPAHGELWSAHARGVARLERSIERSGPVSLASWEPHYGRLSEAQVKWESAHGRPLAEA
ncbi:MAG: universal protein YeaZ [Gemmatimonadetes bacterium]|nr:universal protein YeaZ [Gemmatimonadota bacterium]